MQYNCVVYKSNLSISPLPIEELIYRGNIQKRQTIICLPFVSMLITVYFVTVSGSLTPRYFATSTCGIFEPYLELMALIKMFAIRAFPIGVK